MPKQRRNAIAVIAIAVLLALIISVIFIATRMTRSPDGRIVKVEDPAARAAAPAAAGVPATRPSNTPRIKVGVYLSHFTANGPNWTGKGWGYNSQVRILREMKSPELELYALIEPGSEQQPDLIAKLNTHFPTRPKLLVTDVAAMRQLDVIVANCVNNVPDDALTALETVVGEGKGLFIRCVMGDFEPGFTPQVARLHGLSDGAYAWNASPVEAQVVGTHPILGTLSGKTGATMLVKANGGFGAFTPNAVPLIRLRDGQPVRAMTDAPEEWPFYPLYVSSLGKGRIVVCSMAGMTETPQELLAATEGKFVVRAITWAARRPLP
jgi:hypothetical protein